MRERGKCDEGKRGRPIVRRGQSQITQQEKGCGVSSSLCKRAKENAMIVLAVPVSLSPFHSLFFLLFASPLRLTKRARAAAKQCAV